VKLPPLDAAAAFEELIRECTTPDRNIYDKLAGLSASIALCRHWAACRNYIKATETYRSTEDMLHSLSLTRMSISSLSVRLDWEYADIEVFPNDKKLNTAEAMANHARRAKALRNFGRADYSYTEACELALQSSAWQQYSKWRAEHEALLLDDMQNLPDLLIGRSRQWRFGGTKDIHKLIEWYNNFDKSYMTSLDGTQQGLSNVEVVKFDIPLALHTKERAKRAMFIQSGDSVAEDECIRKLDVFKPQLPSDRLSANTDAHLRDWTDEDGREFLGPLRILLRKLISASETGDLDDNAREQMIGPVVLEDGIITNELLQTLFDLFYQDQGKADWPRRANAIRTWLSQHESLDNIGATEYLMVRLQLLRTTTALQSPDEGIRENQIFIQMISSCHNAIKQSFIRNELHSLSTIAICKLMTAKTPVDYDELISIYQQNLARYESDPALRRQLKEIALLHVRIADACQRKRRLFNDPSLEEIGRHLHSAEAIFDELRQDLSALARSDSFRGKTDFTINIKGIAELRDIAYRVYRLELIRNPTSRQNKIQLWNWVQKSKGRALSDIMGLTRRLPEAMFVKARESNAELLKGWEAVNSDLTRALQDSDPNEVYYFRMQREEIKEKMRANPYHRDIVEIMDGRTLEFHELPELFASLRELSPGVGGRVVLVDYFNVTDIVGNVQLYIAVVRLSDTNEDAVDIDIWPVPVPKVQVDNWVTRFLRPKDVEPRKLDAEIIKRLSTPEAFEELQNLKQLIAPLAKTLNAGDRLILCPTGQMHHLPLHALRLPSESDSAGSNLLSQFPVMFCHSLSIFRFCVFSRLRRASEEQHSQHNTIALFPINTGFNDEDIRARFEDLESTAIVQDQQVTPDRFFSLAPSSQSIFFHGVVHDGGPKPLDSHICLYEPTPHQDCAAADATVITASSILERLTLKLPAHITLVACASGNAVSAAADEYLGLVPALLYAGASSTISTLWPIGQLQAVEFDGYFVDKLEESDGLEVGAIDFVGAMQQAALSLIEDYGERNLAAWAGFVFHGAPG
jgi:CHAT domain-containing protein